MGGFRATGREVVKGGLGVLLLTWFALQETRGSNGLNKEGADPVLSESVALKVEGGRVKATIPTDERFRSVLVISVLGKDATTYPVSFRVRRKTSGFSEGRVSGTNWGQSPKDEPRASRIVSTNPRNVDQASAESPRKRNVWIFTGSGDVASASSYVAEVAILRASTGSIDVYVSEKDVARVQPELLLETVQAFEGIRRAVEGFLDRPEDVDGSGRFMILYTSSLASMGRGQDSVEGLFRASDLDSAMPQPFSNHTDLIYLNPAIRRGDQLRAVVAHEYAHAAYTSSKRKAAGREIHEQNWLEEAVAHTVEELATGSRSNIDFRVHEYLENPSRYGLVVEDYYRSGFFRSHGHRGVAYLFLRWCVEKYGPEILGEIAHCPESGTACLESVLGRSFAEIYREWACALGSRGVSEERSGKFAGLDLHGKFGSVQLDGLHPELIDDSRARLWQIPSTATRFIELNKGEAWRVAEVEISAPVDAQLQVTWLRLPASSSEIRSEGSGQIVP